MTKNRKLAAAPATAAAAAVAAAAAAVAPASAAAAAETAATGRQMLLFCTIRFLSTATGRQDEEVYINHSRLIQASRNATIRLFLSVCMSHKTSTYTH